MTDEVFPVSKVPTPMAKGTCCSVGGVLVTDQRERERRSTVDPRMRCGWQAKYSQFGYCKKRRTFLDLASMLGLRRAGKI